MIDAEIGRRRLLEQNPSACMNEDPVNFDTSEIPWWAWVRRFHLPEVRLSLELPTAGVYVQVLNCLRS